MGREYEYGKVIKPPFESMSGKVIKPSKSLRNKMWFEAVATALILWIVTIGTFFGLMYIITEGAGSYSFDTFMATYWELVNLVYWIITACWLLPAIVLIPVYLNSFEYSVRTETGESMPEVYVKKGIITITRKHVPLRSITNVSTKAGPLDRIFKIGNVEIETAGFSGIGQEGPEEKIQGITFYNELRDYILSEMRKFKDPYVLGTEASSTFDEPVPRIDGSLDDEILITLREMRELLKNIDRKLDKGGQ